MYVTYIKIYCRKKVGLDSDSERVFDGMFSIYLCGEGLYCGKYLPYSVWEPKNVFSTCIYIILC
jgi:hypothetical protein